MTVPAPSRLNLSNENIDRLSQRLPEQNYADFQHMPASELDDLQTRSYERLHELQREVDRLLHELRVIAARSRTRRYAA